MRRIKPTIPAAELLRAEDVNIELRNPVSEHFESFVIGNASLWEQLAHADLQAHAPEVCAELAALPDTLDRVDFMNHFHDAVKDHATQHHVVREGEAAGQHLILCGAGPSLAETAAEWCPQGDQIWGCNSAVTWLAEHGHKPTHGFTVDQTPAMLKEWYSVPDVTYLCATTVHPHLSEFLHSRDRTIRFFNNYVGIKGAPVQFRDEVLGYEDWLYCVLFPPTVRAGSGLNSVNRAVDVATYMGFDKITVLGADCALRITRPKPRQMVYGDRKHRRWLEKHTQMHANGGNAITNGQTALTMGGTVDGRYWESKPDMIVSAVWLEMTRRSLEGRLQLIGDTLPNALRDKPVEFLNRLPSLTDSNGQPLLATVG
jgi:hypothetical protein